MRLLPPLALFLIVFTVSVGNFTYTCGETALACCTLDGNVGDCIQKDGMGQSVGGTSRVVSVSPGTDSGSNDNKVAETGDNVPYSDSGLASFVFLMALRLLLVALSAIAVA